MTEARSKVRVAVVGATGYSGQELIRLLSAHPGVELTYIAGSQDAEQTLVEQFPYFHGTGELKIQKFSADECQEKADTVFVALPSGASGEIASSMWKRGKKVIDLSGDLRLPGDTYQTWYNKRPVEEEVIQEAVYGLTEWHREELSSASLVANPGCFATTVLLALLPLVHSNMLAPGIPVIVDAKSGVSGAGRNAVLGNQLGELAENFYPYRVGRHQHTPEIEQELNRQTPMDGLNGTANESGKILLNTQLLPVVRGIYANSYVSIRKDISLEQIYQAYQTKYQNDAFIRVLPAGSVPQLKHVRGSNQCHIGLALSERTGVLQVFSVLDNLQKGAAGQAVQNFNILHGFTESTALGQLPLYP